jgi:hypothetical protein
MDVIKYQYRLLLMTVILELYIISLAGDRYLVLTDDLRLAHYLQKIGIDTVNFNNIRVYGWK